MPPTSTQVRAWLAHHARFIPLHADLVSWLNAIETFFAKLTRQLARGVFRLIVDLQADPASSRPNHDPKPFV